MLKTLLAAALGWGLVSAAAEEAAGDPEAAPVAEGASVPAQAAPPGAPRDENIPFDETGEYVASRTESPDQAEKKAEQDAIDKVLKQRMTVTSMFEDSQVQADKNSQQFLASYMTTFSGGVVNIEKTVPQAPVPIGGGAMKYVVRVLGGIRFNGDPDPSFEIRLEAKEAGGKRLGMNASEFYEGDEVELGFWSTQDAYVQLLTLDSENNAALLYPNEYFPAPKKLKAGEVFRYPGEKAGFRDLKVIAALPSGKDEVVEYLHIILTKGNPLFSTKEAKEADVGPYKVLDLGDRSRISRKLSNLNRSKWTQRVFAYRIKKQVN
ncbi:MAG TPA: hypothetical protein DD417_16795 [Elusimicrobia bacterium]|nr:hypothetical protein [Elusimicrobiota bacterium]